ncbi:capsular exopolysaccharide family protein [Enterococcus haemoperoxidus ATCC BAA-382]|uniref:Tyrosine-protein kinase CpsD n=1 Tax=Enterococcus haemoperoxidus ATCC BAA-382 TaxID=1158608 RepID=R2QXQ8_9ENTE|nr:CpsD/CapB family tyrosine-protein kinase [Enterococcus haemoperoxidus]EOI00171.1 capsular exopolysaccharide family protein [Enterococcus haemoperoxidus ATCC BAA-382]EOT59591.1 tyrosine-protein kinase [Enterococcus haemoperoxidus ATCC BAA-382]OJG52428.1 capsular exopolysaccharide family protein [Enterococcus haemoperoxidus]
MANKIRHQKKQKTRAVSLITLADKSSPISEQFRTIRTNIQYAMVDRDLKTLVITSSGPSEGKSTTSANLAVVFANSGKRVLLVDADMRKPTVAKTFSLDNTRGLSTLLGSREIALHQVVQSSGVDNLFLMTSGPKPPNPSELLDSRRMGELLQELKQQYDLIIFDMPPVVAVTDAQIVSSKSDGTIIVVRENVSKRDSLLKAKNLLEMVDANILGVVYNGSKNISDQGYYYGS